MAHEHITLPYGVLPSAVIDVSTVLGPFFLAQCFNWALYGVLLLQIYIYSIRFPKDLTYIKVLVYTTLILDSFFMACVTHSGWVVLVSAWGDVNVIHDLPWTWAMVPIGSGIVSCLVQLFFVFRIWKLSKKYTMPIIIAAITLAQCAFSIVTGGLAIETKGFKYIRDFLPGFWLIGSILADILICVTLVRILWQSQTGFKDTDSVVLRLIRLSIESAAVPVFCAAIKLALIYSYQDNRHLVFCVVLGRLYSNSLLAMLNCRDPLFGGGSNPNTLAGASRLADGPTTLMSLLKSKLGLSSRSGGQSTVDSRDHFGTKRSSFGFNEKIMVHKTTRTESDFDLELGLRGASSDRDSAYTVDTDSIVESSSKGYIPAPPVSPGTAAATNFMRPQSTMHHGVYETKSELVTAIPGADGRRIMISTPQPALYGIGGRLERPGSALSGSRKTSEDDAFFPGR